MKYDNFCPIPSQLYLDGANCQVRTCRLVVAGRISTFGGWFSNPAEMRPAVDTGAFRVDFPLHRFQNEMKVGQETIL